MAATSSQSTGTSSQTPSQPRCPTYGGRKKRSGAGFDQRLLDAVGRGAPERHPVVVMVIGVRHEGPAADEPGRLTVALAFGHVLDGRRTGHAVGRAGRRSSRWPLLLGDAPAGLGLDGQENARRDRRSLDVPITVNNDQITRCSWLLRASPPYRARPDRGNVAGRSGRYRRITMRASGQAASSSPMASGNPISIGLLIGSWLHSNQPPS